MNIKNISFLYTLFFTSASMLLCSSLWAMEEQSGASETKTFLPARRKKKVTFQTAGDYTLTDRRSYTQRYLRANLELTRIQKTEMPTEKKQQEELYQELLEIQKRFAEIGLHYYDHAGRENDAEKKKDSLGYAQDIVKYKIDPLLKKQKEFGFSTEPVSEVEKLKKFLEKQENQKT